MYIKSIVMEGFKSYGERTEITGFDPMFNAITGLNGSGKSNILDAICFILGITNLSHVRANSLQDLIYKSGHAGINKATVTITFDNSNPTQCPVGFEGVQEIIVTRQIALGGKNKYLINGTNVPNKKVSDLFCSVQLNVNNPHFLIMQGKITKVLNMKPPEILSMVEEAAGTRIYETKRHATQKLIEKKDSKLLEFRTVIKEELSPKLEKLRAEREQYLEYQRTERELEHMMGLYQVWQYFEVKRKLLNAQKALEGSENEEIVLKEEINKNLEVVKSLDFEIEEITKSNESESDNELKIVEVQLKEEERNEAKVDASSKSIKDNIMTEEKKKKQLEKNLTNNEKALKLKEGELSQVQDLFENLKENDRKDREAFALSEKKYEALCAGMEVNDEGEAETLAEQLIKAREDASRASTESKQAAMQLNFCQNRLRDKEKEAGGTSSDHHRDEVNLKRVEQEITNLESALSKIGFSEEHMAQLQEKRRVLGQEVRGLRDSVDNFDAQRPYASFKYRDPETNFDRACVKGVVGRLITCKDIMYATALETAAGGRLYNVIIDTEVTGKKLLQRGDLQTRTTFIPLNKVTSHKMDPGTIRLAQNLVGKENCQPALQLINYDQQLEPAMNLVFGNVFVCKNLDVAKQVAFHKHIMRRCVTLDGDSVDPSGTLSGGARQKGEPMLKQLQNVLEYENQLKLKESELRTIENKIRQLTGVQEQYNGIKQKLELSRHEHNLIKQRLLNTSFHRSQEEVAGLKAQIDELQARVQSSKAIEQRCVQKARDLEVKMKDSTGYREKKLKEAEAEMKQLKRQADKSKEEWRQREQEYETLTLEIAELKKSIENVRQDLLASEAVLEKLQEEFEEVTARSKEVKDKVKALQTEVSKLKASITARNSEAQQKVKKRDRLLARNNEIELAIKKHKHKINELKNSYQSTKHKEQEYSKRIAKYANYMEKGEALSSQEGHDLERRIKVAQEKKHKLGRVVNAQAQTMFEEELKAFNEMVKKQGIVEVDKQKLIKMISELDQKKKNALELAHEQVSKDFGSIFATLLPGANAKLVAPFGKNILQGLEIKVSLGNVWKDSLTELSGGQRSLAALSLVLAMLLFKPAPLYILDEVDAALDLSHTQNIGSMLRSHFKKSQFVIVSLKDGMFNNANVLFRTKFVDGVSTVQRTENTRKG
ncbi:structural maintenance of chromosomes protein 2 [Cylas formicarius]|uniref:structural maintenance of chromosomes protein 2 n=1 Tax=Cylas formicarius TaxID=197179 RepID=UPI00295847C4|nr:structural maintenance of chromosomes protein 2 [Cylas formicarius]XP_060524481.1 structural maintenance of chromosomes protein 2 [Cylas formicarius]